MLYKYILFIYWVLGIIDILYIENIDLYVDMLSIYFKYATYTFVSYNYTYIYSLCTILVGRCIDVCIDIEAAIYTNMFFWRFFTYLSHCLLCASVTNRASRTVNPKP